MGYTSGWNDKATLIAELKSYFKPDEILKEAVTKNPHAPEYTDTLWILTAEHIVLFWIGYDNSKECRGGRWGYKDMTVSMGANDHTCPRDIIEAAGRECFTSYGRDWLTKWGQVNRQTGFVKDKLAALDTPSLGLAI